MGSNPNAGLLFAAFDVVHAAALSAIRSRYPSIELAGSTSAGEMSSVLGFQEDSLALALFAAEGIDITSGPGHGVFADPESAARSAVEEARSKTGRDPRLCLVLPAMLGAERVLDPLRQALGADVAVFGGGAAAADPRDPATVSYQFAGDVVAADGVAVLLFSGDVTFSSGVETGWRPIGPRGTVTRSSADVVHEIDGRPAADFYERYLGPGGEPAFGNPLAVYQHGGDGFFLRAPVRYDRATGAVTFAATVPEGATVQLTVATSDEIFEGTKSALSRALEGYPQGARPDAALVFSCAIRKFVLGTRAGTEIEMARGVFGEDLPVAGFYCYGEIAGFKSAEGPGFHNETIVALLLGSR